MPSLHILNKSFDLFDAINGTWPNTSTDGYFTRAKPPAIGIFGGRGPLDGPLACFLVQATLILCLSRLLHIVLKRLRQPRVVAEIISGICLGPSVLGNIPGFTATIFPPDSMNLLKTVSDIGLVFYIFLVGLELDPRAVFSHIKHSAAVSMGGIVLPFALGVAGSWGLYNYLFIPNEYDISFTSFFLFIGVAMTITAFPVLARILGEKKMLNTTVGLIAISAAMLDNAIAWTLLTLVISILNAGDTKTALYKFLSAWAFSLLLLVAVRPLFALLFNIFLKKKVNPISQFFVALVFIGMFVSAFITNLIGVNFILGAFLFGLIIPRENSVTIRLTEKIEDVVVIGFLPLFFASSGLKTNVGLLNDGTTWLWLVIMICIAMFGKIFGCSLMAKYTGIGLREAISVGVLMNTKGFVELIVLNIGFDNKVINDRIFMIMVIMALFTTIMTSPMIAFVYPPRFQKPISTKPIRVVTTVSRDDNNEEVISTIPDEQTRVLVCLDDRVPLQIVAKLLWLLKVDSNDDDYIINTLKIVENSERSSSILLASQVMKAIKNDPDLNMMSLFGSLINTPTRSFMVTSSTLDEVRDEVAYIVNSEECNLILLPWHGQNEYGSFLSSNSHHEQLMRIVRTSTATTAVYVPLQLNTIGPYPVAKHVLVPFVEGLDYLESLKLALRVYRHGKVKITIFKVNLTIENLANGNLANGTTDDILAKLQMTDGNVLLEEAKRLADEDVDHRLTYRSVTTDNVVNMIVTECQTMAYDLVILGRDLEAKLPKKKIMSHTNMTKAMAAVNHTTDSNRTVTSLPPPPPMLPRSKSETHSIRSGCESPRSFSIDLGDEGKPTIRRATVGRRSVKVNTVNELLGNIGQQLCENELSSVLVVHRNNVEIEHT